MADAGAPEDDALLEGAADDFFGGGAGGGVGDDGGGGGGGSGGGGGGAGNVGGDEGAGFDEGAAGYGADAAEAEAEAGSFPLRRLRPLVREREEHDGNIDDEAAVVAGAAGAGAGADGAADAASSDALTSLPAAPLAAARSAELAAASKDEGNRLFAAGAFEAAAVSYTEALRRCPRDEALAPQRAVFYCNRAACALALSPPRHEDVLYDCDRALELRPGYAKALARRAAALEATGALDEALRDLQALTALEPGDRRSAAEAARVLALTTERDEKLKAEMFDKLKGLGNSLLGNFGLSLDNFKAVQGPDGAYSISFQR